MAQYIKFDLSDDQSIIARINEDVTVDVFCKIYATITDRINSYYEKNPDPDSDEIVLKAVLDRYAKELGFTYEFIPISLTVEL